VCNDAGLPCAPAPVDRRQATLLPKLLVLRQRPAVKRDLERPNDRRRCLPDGGGDYCRFDRTTHKYCTSHPECVWSRLPQPPLGHDVSPLLHLRACDGSPAHSSTDLPSRQSIWRRLLRGLHLLHRADVDDDNPAPGAGAQIPGDLVRVAKAERGGPDIAQNRRDKTASLVVRVERPLSWQRSTRALRSYLGPMGRESSASKWVSTRYRSTHPIRVGSCSLRYIPTSLTKSRTDSRISRTFRTSRKAMARKPDHYGHDRSPSCPATSW
jgi:hypothetical protein